MDLSTPALSVSTYTANEVNVLGSDAPTIGADGTLYISTGNGVSDPGQGYMPIAYSFNIQRTEGKRLVHTPRWKYRAGHEYHPSRIPL